MSLVQAQKVQLFVQEDPRSSSGVGLSFYYCFLVAKIASCSLLIFEKKFKV